MTPQDLLRHFKTITAAAEALQIKPPSISEWVKNDSIPIDRQCQVEVITDGALRADRTKLSNGAAA